MNRAEITAFITSSILGVLFVWAVSEMFDAGFWETLLWITAIQIGLWTLRLIGEVICLVVIGTGATDVALLGKEMKALGFPEPSISHTSTSDYLEDVRRNSELDADVRVEAAILECGVFYNNKPLTFPAQLLNGHYNRARFEVLKRELA